MLEELIKYSPDYLNELDVALSNNDIKEINFIAHKIKGSLKLIGAEQLENLALQIEIICTNSGNPSEVSELLLQLKAD